MKRKKPPHIHHIREDSPRRDKQSSIYKRARVVYNKDIVENTRSMYNSALQPLLHPEITSKIKIDNDKDPVCGMKLVGFADTVHYKGKIIGFCSARCKNGFTKNPTAYKVNMLTYLNSNSYIIKYINKNSLNNRQNR